MKLSAICSILEKNCPFSLAPFEHNGLLTNYKKNSDIDTIGFTLGYSRTSLQKAIQEKVKLLVVHNSPEDLSGNHTPYDQELKNLIYQNNLIVYRLHLPLDFATDGIIYNLCSLMDFEAIPQNLIYSNVNIKGGVYMSTSISTITIEDIKKKVMLLRPKTMRIVKGSRQIKRIAITSGDGCKPDFLLQLNPDVYICGLLNQEAIRIANDLGITLVEATSYSTENLPMKKFVFAHKKDFPSVDVKFLDVKNDVEVL